MEFRPVPQDRETLYNAVWSRPVREVAKDFGLSDRGLALLCRRHKVPVPPRGYWAKKQAGEDVKQARLPKLRENTVQIPEIDERKRSAAVERRKILDEANRAAPQVAAQRQLEDPHPLVAATAKTLRASSVDEDGILHARSPHRLAIRVTKESLERALLIMDAIIKALTSEGFEVGVDNGDKGAITYVVVEEERVVFELFEELETVERSLTKTQMLDKLKNPSKYLHPAHDQLPTGRLVILITNRGYSDGVRGRFADGTSARLDRNLHAVVAGLIAAGKKKHTDRLAQEQREREWQAQRKREEEARRRQEREDCRWELLKRDLGEWQMAEEIRAYVKAKRDRAKGTGEEVPDDSSLGRFLKWASAAAERLDPVRRHGPPRQRQRYAWEEPLEDEW